ncbi:hypothetical protein F4775DRAFT_573798 [Biscogniauxia sp. FL1348]|nr:hypothetical protein F4775DRAFT_573798 [Biscogniauxia sp. FL1348]
MVSMLNYWQFSLLPRFSSSSSSSSSSFFLLLLTSFFIVFPGISRSWAVRPFEMTRDAFAMKFELQRSMLQILQDNR